MVGWMKPLTRYAQARIRDLKDENRRLRREISRIEKQKEQLHRDQEKLIREQERMQRQQERLRQERDGLKQELELARRAGRRQAAPFSKGTPKANPKRPGRQPGGAYGRKGHRPIPDHVDEEIGVPLPNHCPDCGGPSVAMTWTDQYQTEIVRKTQVTHFCIEVGRCRQCGKRVQGRHPRQSSDAVGAAGSQLGPEAVALATVLNKQLGLAYSKTAAVLEQGFGLRVTRGALSHAMQRVAGVCQPAYESLIRVVRSSPSVTADETGWRVGGHRWWLWVVATDEVTVYGILPGRGFAQAAQLLGGDFGGFLVHDGWCIYDRFVSAFHQSCQQHLIRRCTAMAENQSATAAAFPLAVKRLLQHGLQLRDRHAEGGMSDGGLSIATGKIEARLRDLLQRNYRLQENQRLANHLVEQSPHLFTYLRCPGLEATNWRAEQALRPAVVARKVWGGNRTETGAHTQEVLMSVLRTCHQQARDSIPLLVDLLRSPTRQPLDFSIN